MWVWESDAKAVADAQKELDDFKTDQAIEEIDKQIDGWEEYKKKWDDVSKDFETSQNKLIATALLGNDLESQILAQRLDIWKTWQKDYVKILQEIENATSQYNNNQAAQYQNALGLRQTTNPTYNLQTKRGVTVNGHASGSPFIGRGQWSTVDEHGTELLIRNPAQGRYTFLQHGDGVLNASLTRRIMDFANNPDLAIFNSLGRIMSKAKLNTANGGNQIINISNINLPNVTNANQFVKQLQLISQNH